MHRAYIVRNSVLSSSFCSFLSSSLYYNDAQDKKIARSPLFGVIPPTRRKSEQVAHWSYANDAPTYILTRRPVNLKEINQQGHLFSIWHDNGTLKYISPHGTNGSPKYSQRYLSMSFYGTGLNLYIVGRTDDAIAETVAFFMDVEEPEEASFTMHLSLTTYGGSAVDFRAAGPNCLTSMLGALPSRDVRLYNLLLGAEQSAALTRVPRSIDLLLFQCSFEDEGTAFVSALQNRPSNFGSLSFGTTTGLSEENLKGLLQVSMVQYLSLPLLNNDELALSVFSSQAKSLDYDISSEALRRADFESLHIETTRLSLRVHYDSDDFPTEIMLRFWRRVAALGHFVNLSVRIILNDDACRIPVPDSVVREFIRAIVANGDLDLLAVSDRDLELYWEPHLPTIFEGVKDHPGLRALGVHVHNKELAFGREYCHLCNLLSHNRIIAVTNEFGDVYLDGKNIDKLYVRNTFYRGSKTLSVEPPANRSMLVTTALMKSASKDFQRSALLLSNHADALCVLVQFSKLDELSREDPPPRFIQGAIAKRNRGRKTRGRRDAK